MNIQVLTLTLAVLLVLGNGIALAVSADRQAGPIRGTTYEEKSLGRLRTLCSDGNRAVHTWNKTLSRWESTITPPPGRTCTGRLNKAQQWEGRCR